MCRSTLISQHFRAFNLHHRLSAPSSQPQSLSTSIIADLCQDLNLHRRFMLISQPPSSPIYDSLPFTIVDLQSLPFTISDLRVKVVVFSNFLFISLIQSHASSVSICVLWIYGLLVFVDLWVSLDLFLRDGSLYWVCRSILLNIDLFFQICEICGLWFVFRSKSDPTAVQLSLIRLDPWFFTIRFGFLTSDIVFKIIISISWLGLGRQTSTDLRCNVIGCQYPGFKIQHWIYICWDMF